jgi:HEAT repeat protein
MSIARAAPDVALAALLGVLGEGGTGRPVLRRAVSVAAGQATEEGRRAATAWVQAGQTESAAASAALALSSHPWSASLSTRLIERTAPNAHRFEERWRLVLAAARLPSSPDVDRWLTRTATDADEWMLRAAALASLSARGAQSTPVTARRALSDPYPRVRLAAIGALPSGRGTTALLAPLMRRDPWPMVRAAVVGALAADPDVARLLAAALADNSKQVRAAVVRALHARGDRGAAPLVAARLLDSDEWPEVMEAGIAYARELCVVELAAPLSALMVRGMRHDAWAPDVDLSVAAVEALGVLGGQVATEALERASSPASPGPIRQAASRARQHGESCVPGRP